MRKSFREDIRQIWEVLLKMQTSTMRRDDSLQEQVNCLFKDLSDLRKNMAAYQELLEARREEDLKEKNNG